jgi:hypothetical protein
VRRRSAGVDVVRRLCARQHQATNRADETSDRLVWCIAESGERKTATDYEAFAPQKQHEKTLHAKYKEAKQDYDTRKAIWEMQSKAIDKQYKDPAAAGSDAHRKEREQLGAEPEQPLITLIMASDFTFEGLVQCLNFGQPLYGIIGAEGG